MRGRQKTKATASMVAPLQGPTPSSPGHLPVRGGVRRDYQRALPVGDEGRANDAVLRWAMRTAVHLESQRRRKMNPLRFARSYPVTLTYLVLLAILTIGVGQWL